MRKVGIQMYSLRELCEKDFVGTLEQVAKAGYDAIELAGTYGLTSKELKGHLDRLGLEVSGAHIDLDRLKNEFKEVAKYQRVLGNNLLIVPWASTETLEEVQALIAGLNEISIVCQQNSFRLSYHNHSNEFNEFNSQYALMLIKNGTPASLEFEIDTYWASVRGINVVSFLDTLDGRCTALHLKDIDDEGNNVEVGAGVIPFREILKKAQELNINDLIVEQEDFTIDPIDSIIESYENIQKMTSS
ncbi:sugar phosphate isomerase/epimerase family protein [Pseudogracilibacillus auburnensis]|uniref:sugar phosphate isomerase/epimerase family protein n=1 Tax=Pseudogracilibacillus auburnensis TaxID=1494959 RepID=UPI001A96E147|nr:sugar phosphate isomerase/epimerase [Pseudogracilibacillus auburnensis]MBO1004763.1 sugar phosphate isomerase/epimerase [Pseudogracilibacillus auburnensis]